MLNQVKLGPDVLGRGVYSAPEALRLLNFARDASVPHRRLAPKTVSRWLRGYEFESGHSEPLWRSDYANDDGPIEISFRDLIELRFVKAFRDAGLGLQTIRHCFLRAVEEVQDERPFSTQRFRTDGKTIFIDITSDVHEGEMIDLKSRQAVFRSIVAPSLRDLEFDASAVSRWFPLGTSRRSIVVDPARSFGRPLVSDAGIPTQVLAQAVEVEGTPERVARLYSVPLLAVRDALHFERQLAA